VFFDDIAGLLVWRFAARSVDDLGASGKGCSSAGLIGSPAIKRGTRPVRAPQAAASLQNRIVAVRWVIVLLHPAIVAVQSRGVVARPADAAV
jgi:hypothetical protein